MSHWIKYPTSLKGEVVELLPLENRHFEELIQLFRDERIWEFTVLKGSDKNRFAHTLYQALEEREKGREFPFIIFHKQDKKIIGSTRFMDIHHAHKKLEIGWTWLLPEYWATEVNLECKLLLLTHCFECLNAVRVQLKTDQNNLRSRKAIEKIGGKFEGILRNDMLRDDGTNRNSAYFSILASEWKDRKPKLMQLFSDRRKAVNSAQQ